MTQRQWRTQIKARTRANDLDALRVYFAIRANHKWNNELARERS